MYGNNIRGGNILLANDSNLSSTGTGNAKTTLDTGVTIEEIQSADFGTIIRFGSKPKGQIVIDRHGNITSTNPNIHTDALGMPFIFKITGDPNTIVDDFGDSDGYIANSDGTKKIRIGSWDGTWTVDFSSGVYIYSFGAAIDLDGTELDGEYSTTNPGGKPILINIDY